MRFLLDEVFPAAAAGLLRSRHGHDAVHVSEVGLLATEDTAVAACARAEDRVMVTENVGDYAAERDVVLVFILKQKLPRGAALAAALTELLASWAAESPEPYIGHHWPHSD